MLVLPETDTVAAGFLAERARYEIECCRFKVSTGRPSLTISLGVAGSEFGGRDLNFDQLVSRADAALYDAKEAGRNRVRLWSPEMAGPDVQSNIAQA